MSTHTHTTIIKDAGHDYELTVTAQEISGRPEVTEVVLRSVNGGRPVSHKLMRSISIADSVRAIQARGATPASVGETKEYDLSPITENRWTASDEQLQLIATMYRDAYKARIPVQEYVASRVNRPVSSANRWIRIARERGFLGKPDGTRGGEV